MQIKHVVVVQNENFCLWSWGTKRRRLVMVYIHMELPLLGQNGNLPVPLLFRCFVRYYKFLFRTRQSDDIWEWTQTTAARWSSVGWVLEQPSVRSISCYRLKSSCYMEQYAVSYGLLRTKHPTKSCDLLRRRGGHPSFAKFFPLDLLEIQAVRTIIFRSVPPGTSIRISMISMEVLM